MMNKTTKRGVAFVTLLVLIITLFSVNVFASDNTQLVRKELLTTENGYYCSLNEQYAYFGENAQIYIRIITNEYADSHGVTFLIRDEYSMMDYFSPNTELDTLFYEYVKSELVYTAPDITPFKVIGEFGVESIELYVMVEEQIAVPSYGDGMVRDTLNIVFMQFPAALKNSVNGFIYNGEPNVSPIAVRGFEWCAFALALSVFVALIISITDTLRRK